MSFHRENITWISRDGTWNRGFYDHYRVRRDDGEDEDPEWDVEYDYSAFNWVSTGHATLEAANDAWTGANPGSGSVLYAPNDETDQLDAMAKAFKPLRF